MRRHTRAWAQEDVPFATVAPDALQMIAQGANDRVVREELIRTFRAGLQDRLVLPESFLAGLPRLLQRAPGTESTLIANEMLKRIANEQDRSPEVDYWGLVVATEAANRAYVQEFLVRVKGRANNGEFGPVPEATAWYSIARAHAFLGEDDQALQSLLRTVDTVKYLIWPSGSRVFDTTTSPWEVHPRIDGPLTLLDLSLYVYLVHVEFESLIGSDLHSAFWDALDERLETDLRIAIARREAGEPYLQHPADYVLARSLLAQREALDPLIERAELR
jgi:hypothetical protein